MRRFVVWVLAFTILLMLMPAPVSAATSYVYVQENVAGTMHEREVRSAVSFVDQYTRTVIRYGTPPDNKSRSITINPGRLSTGAETGFSKSIGPACTVTVDTRRVNKPRAAAYWRRLYEHEIAHCYGLGHSSGNNLMYAPLILPSGSLVSESFAPSQKAVLAQY